MTYATTRICCSQAVFWTLLSVLLFSDYLASSRLAAFLLPKFLQSFIVFAEVFSCCVAIANAAYCGTSYWMHLGRKPENTLKLNQKFKGMDISQRDVTTLSIASAPAKLNISTQSAERAKHLSKVSTFLESFLVSSLKMNASMPEAGFRSKNSSFSSSALNKDTSLNSTLGYHDSPLMRSSCSIYTQQQLNRLLSEDTCDSVADTSSHMFANSFCDENRVYQVGTYIASQSKTESAKSAEELALSKEQGNATGRASISNKMISDSLGRFSRESSPSTSTLSSVVSPSTISGSTGKQRRYESELPKVFMYYGIHISEMEDYELKLRIWISNTIIRPFVQKVDDLNDQLSEKFSSLHLKVGVSPLDSLKSNLSSRIELWSTYLPYVLPYLRLHTNQNYLVQRFRMLSENVALENFCWDSGSAEIICDEADGFMRSQPWSDRLPTDSELIWFAFCTYMDYHLAPCPNYGTGEFFKPFSNVYFLKAEAPTTALHTAADAFFIRMASTHPPLFEFVFNGGGDVIVPNKEDGNNLWLVMLLFLAHVEKFNCSRIGHLHLSAVALDILDV